MAQLVNAIAPIMTEPGGDAWRQTTFCPLAVTSRLAVRSSLLVKLESDTYQTDLHGEVPTVDAVATHDPETGQSAIYGADMQRPRSPSTRVDWVSVECQARSRRVGRSSLGPIASSQRKPETKLPPE
jgi:alpha-N-arabinofuranosidase